MRRIPASVRASILTATSRLVFLAVPLALTLSAPGSALASSPSPQLIAEFEQDPLAFVDEIRTSDVLNCGSLYLRDTSKDPSVRRPALVALASVYVAHQKPSEARMTVMELLRPDPSINLDAPDRVAPSVKRLFYALRDSMLQASGRAVPPDVKTVAFGDIESNALVKGKYDLDAFARGLTQIMITDLNAATPLKIVDRQRLNTLREEIGMSSNEQIVDKQYSVPLGRLTGAQSYLFGQIMQVTSSKMRMDLRWVETATSEILLAASVEVDVKNSKDLFKLERSLLVDKLAPAIEKLLKGEKAADGVRDRTKSYLDSKASEMASGNSSSYVEYLLKTGEAMSAEDRGDTKGALVAWKAAKEIRKVDALAENRSNALAAFNSMQEEGNLR